jgi:hypothetical protein
LFGGDGKGVVPFGGEVLEAVKVLQGDSADLSETVRRLKYELRPLKSGADVFRLLDGLCRTMGRE